MGGKRQSCSHYHELWQYNLVGFGLSFFASFASSIPTTFNLSTPYPTGRPCVLLAPYRSPRCGDLRRSIVPVYNCTAVLDSNRPAPPMIHPRSEFWFSRSSRVHASRPTRPRPRPPIPGPQKTSDVCVCFGAKTRMRRNRQKRQFLIGIIILHIISHQCMQFFPRKPEYFMHRQSFASDAAGAYLSGRCSFVHGEPAGSGSQPSQHGHS